MKHSFDMSDNMIRSYFGALVDRTFKILPLYEESNEGLHKYIKSLSFELSGLRGLVTGLDVDVEYVTLIVTFEALAGDIAIGSQADTVKREVFKCISIIKKIMYKTSTESGGLM